jgi:hypothetical protein
VITTEEVLTMHQDDLDEISKILSKYDLIEWTVIGFDSSREYKIFSYFTDLSIMPVFKCVLISMLKTIEQNMEETNYRYEIPCGNC